MNIIDRFLNNITMYRLVMYYLIVLLAIAAIFGAVGWLPYSPIAIVFSTLFLVIVAWIVNGICAAFMKIPANSESVYITALILALIITPGMPTDMATIVFLAWATVLAMASKYVLAIDKKHIFNPAAFAVAVTALAFGQTASWWIGGNLPMMAFVIVGGALVLRKVQRFDLAAIFLVFALASDVVTHAGLDPVSTIEKALVHTPLFFFASIMLTEPMTTPPTRTWRLAYGALVGALFSPFIAIGAINSSPELALLVGNVFSFIVSPKGRRVLTLAKKEKVSNDIYHFTFTPDKPLAFRPGQYLEWTLGHNKVDGRGNRRYFTIASSPTEPTIQLGVKFYEPSSSFKRALLALTPGDTIMAGQLAGDFTLPKNSARGPAQKLAFIAGGIGITPFRSMVKDLIDRGEKRDAVLFYSNRTEDEIAFRDVFDEAREKLGMKTHYVITGDAAPVGSRIDADMIRRELPDYRERLFYISGTHAMTNAFRHTLREMGVPRAHIKTDFFPGFA
ncbi:MAG TPA: RnfABCDGE type electron transport complex subunit D [Candidatus Paceibacterota bacterium]|nr:RnfABCDGE type electron transport complex subunit D [Candidatus Paceibacterota bacterium]